MTGLEKWAELVCAGSCQGFVLSFIAVGSISVFKELVKGQWSRAVIRLTSQKNSLAAVNRMDRARKALADVGKGAEKLLWLLKGGWGEWGGK